MADVPPARPPKQDLYCVLDNMVGLYYDTDMEKHKSTDDDHQENPERTRAIWNKLKAEGILKRKSCVLIKGKQATDEHLSFVHTREHMSFIDNPKKRSQRYKNCIMEQVYFNAGSSLAARLAAGGAVEVARQVVDKEINSGFAIVRPPGHHAEPDGCKGFCLYNNIAVAASFLLEERAHCVQRILIVDWDIHHGNGTQRKFYNDNRVLYFSIHRYGDFYPYTEDGSLDKIGDGNGTGFNINVPWDRAKRSNADYLAVMDHILLPVARVFKPDIVLVSAGFDAAKDDPIGDCVVTAEGFADMLKKLRELATGGKVVLVLEGGYGPDYLADCVLACVEVLTQAKESKTSHGCPHGETYDLIKLVRETLSPHWPVLKTPVLAWEADEEQLDNAAEAVTRIFGRLDDLITEFAKLMKEFRLLGESLVESLKAGSKPGSGGSSV